MAKNHKTLEEIVEICIDNLKKHKMTIDELCQTFDLDKVTVEAIIDPENSIINTLSRMITGSGCRLTSRIYDIPIHTHKYIGNYLLITRLIEPKCTVNYDFSEQKFFRFKQTNKHNRISITDKQSILFDFEEYRQKISSE